MVNNKAVEPAPIKMMNNSNLFMLFSHFIVVCCAHKILFTINLGMARRRSSIVHAIVNFGGKFLIKLKIFQKFAAAGKFEIKSEMKSNLLKIN